MAMTPKGIYIPEGDTNVDFLSVFSTLASSIDSALGDFTYDSGWINVATSQMQNGWTTYNTTGFQVGYRRVGKHVHFRGLIRYGTPNTVMFNIPVGFRPSTVQELVYCMASGVIPSDGGHKGVRIDVRYSGEVFQVGNNVNLGNGFISLSNISYFVD